MGPAKVLAVLADSAQSAMPVALACATVGIVVGVVSATSLGLKLAAASSAWPAASMLATLLLTMIAALVLGTGLPTSATYIITSIMAAPALIQLGIPKLVATCSSSTSASWPTSRRPRPSRVRDVLHRGRDVWKTQWTAMLLALRGSSSRSRSPTTRRC